MAGIFPDSGTVAANTRNGASPVNLVEGCAALYYRGNCVPVFDPFSTNAIISEIVNAINLVSDYDCSRLDNLRNAMQALTSLCGLNLVQKDAVVDGDSIAGCFSNVSGRITINDLLDIIRGEVTACDLQISQTITKDDFVICCVGGQQVKVPFSAFKSQPAPTDQFKDGRYIYSRASYSGNNSGSFDVGDVKAFRFFNEVSSGAAPRPRKPVAIYNGADQAMFATDTRVIRYEDYWYGQEANSQAAKRIGLATSNVFSYQAGNMANFEVYELIPVEG